MAVLMLAAESRQTWSSYIAVLGMLAGVLLVLWVINRLIIHFFPSTRDYHAIVGNALMRVEANFLPGRDHVMEAREREDVEEDDEGEPPETGRKLRRTGSSSNREP